MLDLTGGGETVGSWGIAFASIAVVTLVGPPVLLRMVREEAKQNVKAETV